MKIEKTNGSYTVTMGKRSCTKKLECDACPLFRKLRINPDYREYNQILAIGEGPGAEERIRMLFFTGASGTYLREVVRDTGAGKFGVGYGNIIYCEGGKQLEFEDPKALWETIDLCTELYLWPDIDRLKPKLLCPLGNYPKSVFLEGERRGIGACAGIVYEVKGEDYNIIPLHHPAHVIRNPKTHERYWDEWNEVRLYFTEKPGPFVTHIGDEKSFDILETFDELAVDFETTSFHPWDSGKFIARGKEFYLGDILCISVNGDGLNSYVFPKEEFIRLRDRFKKLFESKGVVCFNGPFDLPFLKKYGINPKLIHDPMLMSYSTDESPGHSLKRLSRRNLGLEDWSEELEKYPDKAKSYAFIPEEVLYLYCGMDTASTKQNQFVIWDKMDKDDRRLYTDLLLPCANMFSDTNYRGIRIDVRRLMELKKRWSKRRLTIVRKLKAYGVRNANSPYQVSDALIKLEVVRYDAVTAKSNLMRLARESREVGNEKGATLCELVVEYRELTKAIGTVLFDIASSMSEIDCRIHPDAKLFGTVTGRLVYGNPSLLNFPHATRLSEELRTLLLPDEGYLWGHRDQKQFELRIYAVIGNDGVLKQVFVEDRDPHSEVGAYYYHSILGFPDGMAKYLEEDGKSKGYIRVCIKACNFGTIYGRGEESIADQWGITVREAGAFRGAILEFAPGIKVYWSDVEEILNEEQVLINPFGRKRRFPILVDSNYHDCLLQAWNFPVSSTANDCNLKGMLEMHNSPYGDLLSPFFPVHDCVEYQVEEKHQEEIEAWITEALARVPTEALQTTDMKFVTDGGLGYDWAEASL